MHGLGQRLALLTAEKNLSPQDLARRGEFKKSSVYAWINGVRTPNCESLVEIARVLNLRPSDLGWLVTGGDRM